MDPISILFIVMGAIAVPFAVVYGVVGARKLFRYFIGDL